MSKVDWSLAPEGATHKVPKGCWYKIDGDQVFCWSNTGNWSGPYPIRQYQDGSMEEMVKRQKQPITWSGDGSIPMGAEVEIHHSCWNASEWIKCKIMYMSDAYVIVNHWGLDEQHYHARDITVRAIPTPAQLRESAIRELMDIAQVDCRVTAARLVDAGFKREMV